MTDPVVFVQRGIAHQDDTYGPFEEVTQNANGNVVDGNMVIRLTRTNIGDSIADNSIPNPGCSTSVRDRDAISIGVPFSVDRQLNIKSNYLDILTEPLSRLEVSIHPDDFASAVTTTSHIVDGDNMSFLGHDSEVTSDLVTLMIDAVGGELRSLLADMLPTRSAPEAVPAPHFSSAAPSTTVYLGGPPPIFERGRDAVVTGGQFDTCTRGIGNVLLTFLKSMFASTKTTQAIVALSSQTRTMTRPRFWSGRSMAFAQYDRPHGCGGRVGNEMEKRYRLPVL